MKLCTGCKWFVPADSHRTLFLRRHRKEVFEFAKCSHPEYCNPVDGSSGNYCSVLREHAHLCGKEARYWEPKQ